MAGLVPSIAPKWSRPESGTWTSSSARKAIAVLPSTIVMPGPTHASRTRTPRPQRPAGRARGLPAPPRRARLDPRLLHAHAVHEAAVGALQVAQQHAALADEQLGVQ